MGSHQKKNHTDDRFILDHNLFDADQYRFIYENAPFGIFKMDADGSYLDINKSICILLGYDTKEKLLATINSTAKDIFIDTSEKNSLLKKALKNNTAINVESSLRHFNGDLVPVLLSLRTIKNNGAENAQIIGFVQDYSDKRILEDTIQQERNNIQTLIDYLSDYVYIKDLSGNFIAINKAFKEMANVTDVQEINEEISPNDFLESLLKDDSKVLLTGKKILNREVHGISPRKRKMVYAFITKTPIKNAKGKITGLIGIGKNITDLKMAEERIMSSQANLNAVLESATNPIWSVNKSMRFITLNSPSTIFFKTLYKQDISIGDHAVNSILDNTERKEWKNRYIKALKGEHWKEEHNIVIDNKNKYYVFYFHPIIDQFHNIKGVTVFSLDITDRRNIEEVIKESEERFRQLAENTTDAFTLSDQNKIIYANPAFEKIYGIKIKHALENPLVILDCLEEKDKTKYLNNRKEELKGLTSGSGNHYSIIRKSGEKRRIWLRNFPIYNNKAEIYRYVTVTTDITELVELESTISETRNQQKAILDNIPYLAWLKDNNGRYISVNQSFAKLYNTDINNIIGKTDFDFFPSKMAEKYQYHDQQVMSNGKRQLIEEVKEIDDGMVWMETFKAPILNEKGEIIGITGISRDITDRKKMEETIIESEEYFRSLLQNSSDEITILDEEGLITFESSLKNKISDFTIEELIGKSIFDVVHPDDKENFINTFNSVLKTSNRQIKIEYRSLHKNKKWIYVESIFSNQLKNTAINGIVVNSRDISERKMAELKERVYHDNLIFLSNSALDLLSISSREDIYSYISEKLYSFLEYAIVLVTSFDEENQMLIVESIAGSAENKTHISKALNHDPRKIKIPIDKTITKLSEAGIVITLKDELNSIKLGKINKTIFADLGERLKVNKVYNITLARHNKLLGNITIFTVNKNIIKFKHIIETFVHQVSVALHRSQLEHELVQAKIRAEESDKLKTTFLANMSHEIRTPMNGILGFTEMLNDETTSPANKKKYLDIIHSNGQMLISLIDDIIDFAKIEAGQIKIVNESFSLNGLLSQLHTIFLTEISRQNKSDVTLRMRKALTNDKCFIKSDPQRLKQILNNLIGNALKFTNNGFIEFGYKMHKKHKLLFYVKDTGIGISKEKLKLIFERFVQADSSRSRRFGGSGLGLAISKGFVDLMGGEMWAESVENKGSVFYFTIPFTPTEKVSDSILERRKVKTNYNWKGKVFLIAEDDMFSYKFLEGFLKQTNAEVVHAENGLEALNIIKKNQHIDLVLMDIQMPEMNGLEATEKIKKIKKELPVIAQTANAIIEEKEKCFEAGCDDFITKPINMGDLYTKIDKWLSIHHHR